MNPIEKNRKNNRKPLSLDREILRTLHSSEIANVVGGAGAQASIPECWPNTDASGDRVCCA